MHRPIPRSLTLPGSRRLAFHDRAGAGRPVLALHGHFASGRTFATLAGALAPEWRLIAPDQRGHGDSGRAADYSRDGYVSDAVALLDHLGIGSAVVLGHSLGGVNAYQLAAAHPERVSALVVEDIGAVVDGDLSFALTWPRRAPDRAALEAALGGSAPYLKEAIRSFPDGWGLDFDPSDMVASQLSLNGDHWGDWLASDCPALLVHGTRSGVLSAGHAAQMTAERPRTTLVDVPAGHSVHATAPAAFATALTSFLTTAHPGR
ncbi:alpha/beta hydrolase [Winogradskya consettensis]|nr:alpha/beta hydrolase [Actinoplanes consettensis]